MMCLSLTSSTSVAAFQLQFRSFHFTWVAEMLQYFPFSIPFRSGIRFDGGFLSSLSLCHVHSCSIGLSYYYVVFWYKILCSSYITTLLSSFPLHSPFRSFIFRLFRCDIFSFETNIIYYFTCVRVCFSALWPCSSSSCRRSKESSNERTSKCCWAIFGLCSERRFKKLHDPLCVWVCVACALCLSLVDKSFIYFCLVHSLGRRCFVAFHDSPVCHPLHDQEQQSTI